MRSARLVPIGVMTDIWSTEKRSQVMAAVRSKGNRSTELRMAELFQTNGLKGWRRHQPLPGKPDFVFRREKVAVFVDGCFWHGCPRCYTAPSTRKAFWKAKLDDNRRRDRRVSRQLRAQGWRVVRVWECSLRKRPDASVRRVMRALERSNEVRNDADEK